MVVENTDVESLDVVGQETHPSPQENLSEEQSQQNVQQSNEARNWAETRKIIEEQKRQIHLAQERERLYQAELAKAKTNVEEADETEHLNKNDILTVEQAEKIAEKKFKKLLKQAEDSKGEERMRAKYADYDSVVTPQNLERLKNEDPEEFEAIAEQAKLYGKASMAYKTLKLRYGTVTPEAQENREKIAANANKPRAASSMGATGALSQAKLYENGLTPDLKKQLLSEMVQASRRS